MTQVMMTMTSGDKERLLRYVREIQSELHSDVEVLLDIKAAGKQLFTLSSLAERLQIVEKQIETLIEDEAWA